MQIFSLSPDKSISRESPGSFRAFTGLIAALVLFAAVSSLPASAQVGGAYKVTNLISDGSVPAAFTDASFINPWAISDSGTWWISAQGSGSGYVVASTPTPGTINFKMVVPPASGTSAGLPAGSVTTGGATGMILPNGTKASFLFSTLDGTISGWNSKLGTAGAIAQVAINNSASGASYTGLAIINTATSSFILAANFGAGKTIEVYDSTFKPTKLAGTFTDPSLPAGYAPFSVHVLNNQVYVAYAEQSATPPYQPSGGLGAGVVSVFDITGNFIARVATGGNLEAPWGVAIAPAGFCIFGGSLLIGNFGNGVINAYDPASYAYRGQLTDGTGKALSYASLWELLPGGTTVGNTTSVSGGDPNTVYFTAGLAGEAHGLFGAISNSTTGGTPAFGLSASTGALTVTSGSSVSTVISVAPTYSFSGNVSLACSGLPKYATCSFTPSSITTSGTTPATSTLNIQTQSSMVLLDRKIHGMAAVASAVLFPFASLLVFYRRRAISNVFRMFILCGVMLAALGLFAGCTTTQPATPEGTSQVIVTATSGSVSQTATIALTVQ
jgi:uncharacterized protein (TIGR03118 family)